MAHLGIMIFVVYRSNGGILFMHSSLAHKGKINISFLIKEAQLEFFILSGCFLLIQSFVGINTQKLDS